MAIPRLYISMPGRTLTVDRGDTFTIGRDPENLIAVDDDRVSRRHAEILLGRDEWIFHDLESRNGSFVDGTPVGTVAIPAVGTLSVRLGDPLSGHLVELTIHSSDEETAVTQLGRITEIHQPGDRTVIGREPGCDLVLDDIEVSRRHARMETTGSQTWLVDMRSFNGTFVNGRRVDRAVLNDGDVIRLGASLLRFRDGRLEQYSERGEAWLLASDLVTLVGDRAILNGISFALAPSSLLAVVGPSGAGKSTLLGALTGSRPATTGAVLYGGRDVAAAREELRARVGYVPQDDVVHGELRVRQALDYAAHLRFPPDVGRSILRRRVDEVLGELGLEERADLAISHLSGGQRKRVNVGLELLTRPSLLFLDEPTSGLDPGNEEQLMSLLRDLADGGRTIITVTHSVQSLDVCDRVLFIAPGGVTAFYGPPDRALEYFDSITPAKRYAQVFRALNEASDLDWPGRFSASDAHRVYVEGPLGEARIAPLPALTEPRAPARRGGWARQFSTLVRRYAAVLAADRRTVVLLAVQAPVFGLLYYLLIGPGRLSTRYGSQATMLVWLLVIGATWLGTSNSIREIVKESAVYQRERSVGLPISAYVASKVALLAPLTIVQSVVLVLVGTFRQQLPAVDPDGFLHIAGSGSVLPSVRLELIVGVALAGLAAMSVGLLVSSLVDSSDHALVLLPVILIAQVVLSVPFFVPSSGILADAGAVSSAQWGMAATASTVSLNAIRAREAAAARAGTAALADPRRRPESAPALVGRMAAQGRMRWEHTRSGWLEAAVILVVIAIVATTASGLSLRIRDTGR
jgi:ABC-type multidrug transport system ATPase subunit/pSer/pThr/pTyr-binding forkhead associated (FHA) protein